MLDQNTDRMWYVIGAVIVGAAIIFLANGTLPSVFTSVTESFNDQTFIATDTIDDMTIGARRVGTGNLIRNHDFRQGLTYWYKGPSQTLSDVTIELLNSDTQGRVLKVSANEPLSGMYYRGTDADSILSEGNAYRMRALVRAESPMQLGMAFDGQILSNADIYEVNTEWQWISMLKGSDGFNTRPRIYAVDGGVFYVAEMELFDYIVEESGDE